MFEWSFPTRVVFGLGRFASTHKFIRGFGKRVFVVTSRSFSKGGARSGVLDELLAQLKKIGVEAKVFSEIEPNPTTTTIDRAAALLRDFRPRYVIALGGGSVMDSAKCLAMLAKNEGDIYQYAYHGPIKPDMKPFSDALPVVCIPTVAATSSETDFYAVVTNKHENRKVTLFGDALLPALSIIDPELTYTVSPTQTVDGAFDMITHVMESYLSTPEPAPIQDRMTEAIVETVVHSLRGALNNPTNPQARSQLSWCAALALSGVLSGRNGGWPIHALEHGLSAYANSAHGRGLALLLPRVIDFDSQVIAEKIIAFNSRIFPGSDLKAYMKEVGAWTTLSAIAPTPTADLKEKAVEHALEIKGVWRRGQEPYLTNCRPIYKADALTILEHCEQD